MFKRMLAFALLSGFLLSFPVATESQAKKVTSHPGYLRVDDAAGVFTPAGVKKAEEVLQKTTFLVPTDLVVVTRSEVPEPYKTEFASVEKLSKEEQRTARQKVYESWAKDLAKSERAQGIFVLIHFGPPNFVEVLIDRETDARGFTSAKRIELTKRFVEAFKGNTEKTDTAAEARNAGLQNAVNYVIEELKNTTVPGSTSAPQPVAGTAEGHAGGGSNIGGYVCMGILALGCIWLFVAMFRALMGGGGGGGYGGGGGGGFFPSLMGGLFGAAAGMYLYDQFFNSGSSLNAGESGGDYGSTGDTGAGDFDGGNSGGSDWGDSGGGGDFGGGDFGGGDW